MLEEADAQRAELEKAKAAESNRLLEERRREDELRREQERLMSAEQERALEQQRMKEREEEQQRELEQQRALEAKKKEDDDAAMIQEARARVLARRKQKQLRDSGESLASSVSVSASASSAAPFRPERSAESEAAPTSSILRASNQELSSSMDVAASVSLPSSSISRSAVTSTYRYKDADLGEEGVEEEDGQVTSGGYESSLFGSRDRKSGWDMRGQDSRQGRQVSESIPDREKDVSLFLTSLITFSYVLYSVFSLIRLKMACALNMEITQWMRVASNGSSDEESN